MTTTRGVIAVTRPEIQAGSMVERIRSGGARALLAPLLEIGPPPDPPSFSRAVGQLSQMELAVFSSANAVRAVCVEISRGGQTPPAALSGILLAAVGARTAAALAASGCTADLVPLTADAESLVTLLEERLNLPGARVLLPLGDRARRVLPDRLRVAGAEVLEVIAYQTRRSDRAVAERLEKELLNDSVDVVTFASGSAVDALVAAIGEQRALTCLAKSRLVVLGDTAARALDRIGLEACMVATERTGEGLADAALSVVFDNG